MPGMCPEHDPDPMTNRKLARLCGAMANHNRLNILLALSKGKKTVTQLSRALHLKQSTVSQGLRALRECDLARSVRRGHFRIYEIVDPALLHVFQAMEKLIEKKVR